METLKNKDQITEIAETKNTNPELQKLVKQLNQEKFARSRIIGEMNKIDENMCNMEDENMNYDENIQRLDKTKETLLGITKVKKENKKDFWESTTDIFKGIFGEGRLSNNSYTHLKELVENDNIDLQEKGNKEMFHSLVHNIIDEAKKSLNTDKKHDELIKRADELEIDLRTKDNQIKKINQKIKSLKRQENIQKHMKRVPNNTIMELNKDGKYNTEKEILDAQEKIIGNYYKKQIINKIASLGNEFNNLKTNRDIVESLRLISPRINTKSYNDILTYFKRNGVGSKSDFDGKFGDTVKNLEIFQDKSIEYAKKIEEGTITLDEYAELLKDIPNKSFIRFSKIEDEYKFRKYLKACNIDLGSDGTNSVVDSLEINPLKMAIYPDQYKKVM